jgi:transposase
VKLARTISQQRDGIARRDLSRTLPTPGSSNTRIRLIARRAFGFLSPQALIALAILKRVVVCPPLPR